MSNLWDYFVHVPINNYFTTSSRIYFDYEIEYEVKYPIELSYLHASICILVSHLGKISDKRLDRKKWNRSSSYFHTHDCLIPLRFKGIYMYTRKDENFWCFLHSNGNEKRDFVSQI